jgi:nicotinamide-nucleotide amidase
MDRPEDRGPRAAIRAEILSVGTELLLGSIVDTNAAYLAQRLAGLGIDCYYVSAVGDNLGRLVEVIGRGFSRSDMVVCTGGLGPTGDDLTREAVAAVLGEEAYVEPGLEGALRAFFARRGVSMPERNLKQATLIPSSRAIANPVGTAPGWWVEADFEGASRVGIFMPGVPFEMKRMWEHEVEPALRARSGMVLVSRVLKVLGAGESAVEEMVADLMEGANPTLAPYAKSDGIHVRISAKADSDEHARDLIAPLEAKVRERLGDLVYGVDADTPFGVAGAVAEALGVTYCAMEIGPTAAGALLSGLAGTVAYRDGIAVNSPAEAANLLGTGGESLPDLARSLAARAGAAMVVTVVAETEAQEDDSTIARATVDVKIFDAAGKQVTAQRQSWQVPPGEVPRVAGLLAVNLLRRKLLQMRRGEVGEIAEK